MPRARRREPDAARRVARVADRGPLPGRRAGSAGLALATLFAAAWGVGNPKLAPARATGEPLGTYTVAGTTFAFDILNTGTSPWQYFELVAPPGTAFVGGATAGESTAPCSVGLPDGSPNEIACGPLSAFGLAPGAHVLFIATMTSSAGCGQPFQFAVSSTGSAPYAGVGDLALAGSCAPSAPSPVNCDAGQGLVAAAAAAVRLLGVTGSAAAGSWADKASTALALARGSLIRASDAAGGLPAAFARAVAGALESGAAAASLLAPVPRQEVTIIRIEGTARSALARDRSLVADCIAAGGAKQGAPPPSSAPAGQACGGERGGASSLTSSLAAAERVGAVLAKLERLSTRIGAAEAGLLGALGAPRGGAVEAERQDAARFLGSAGAEIATGTRRLGGLEAAQRAAEQERAAVLEAVAACGG